MPSPGVVLYYCLGNAQGNVARAGGITPGVGGLDNDESDVRARSQDLAGGGGLVPKAEAVTGEGATGHCLHNRPNGGQHGFYPNPEPQRGPF